MTRKRLIIFGSILAAPLVAGIIMTAVRSNAGGVPVMTVRPIPFTVRVSGEGVLKAVTATPITAPVQVRSRMTIGWIVADGTPVKKGDDVVRFDPSDFQRQLEDGKADLDQAHEEIRKTKAQGDAATRGFDLDAELAKRRMAQAETFQNLDDTIFSKFEIIESAIDTDLARAQLDHADTVKTIQEDLSKIQVQLHAIDAKKAQITVDNASQALGAMDVKAPHDGIVVLERNWDGQLPRVGESVWPGRKLAEIPDSSKLEAEIYVLDADAGSLRPGQIAVVSVDSRPDEPLKGKVQRVDSLAKPRFPDVPVQYFGATLSLDRTDASTMKPGQRVRATITIEDLDRALVVPRTAVCQRDGKPVVYVRSLLRRFVPRPVVLGASNAGRVVVTSGLKAGEVVALSDPTETAGASSPGEVSSGEAQP